MYLRNKREGHWLLINLRIIDVAITLVMSIDKYSLEGEKRTKMGVGNDSLTLRFLRTSNLPTEQQKKLHKGQVEKLKGKTGD